MLEKEKITDLRPMSRDNIVDFTIWGMKDPTHKKLGLEYKLNMENMLLFDSSNHPKYFYSIQDILIEYFNDRLRMYRVRKEYIIKELLLS